MKTNIIALCNNYNFKKLFERKGYTYFNKGEYNLNIIGVRHTGEVVTNKFDDALVVIWIDEQGRFCRKVFECTTQPGISYMGKTMGNIKGTAILVPGQYRGAYKIGLHKGKYKALVQAKPVKVYRDNDKDNEYDYNPTTIDEGYFGINIHKAGTASVIVNNWSAGCTVLAKEEDFKSLMYLAKKQVEHGLGEMFTYTLLKQEDLK